MIVPGQNHRDPWFADVFKSVLHDTKYIFRTTAGTAFIFPGTGTGGWEAALTNTLSPGDKVRRGAGRSPWGDGPRRGSVAGAVEGPQAASAAQGLSRR